MGALASGDGRTVNRRRALVGCTGFVGATLARARRFDGLYHSRNVDGIVDQTFDQVVCAAAPGTMWAANQDPEADRTNLERLADRLSRVKADRLVLISTIAVFADPAARPTETCARYETEAAYGRHRRALEERLAARFEHCLVLRLPALFGPGLKKNFVFDLLNPLPSYIPPDRFASAAAALPAAEAASLHRWYAKDARLGLWALDRAGVNASPDRLPLTGALERIGLVARDLTNSASRFQYYNLARLADDIDTALAAGLEVVNLCPEPLEAAVISEALTGRGFVNPGPPRVIQDVRSNHAGLFGGRDGYQFGREAVLEDLRRFAARAVAA